MSIARAVVDYELKDPEGRRVLGIEPGHLAAGPRYEKAITLGNALPGRTQGTRIVRLSCRKHTYTTSRVTLSGI